MIALPATDVVISGVGETAYVRGTSQTAKQLVFEASTLACAIGPRTVPSLGDEDYEPRVRPRPDTDRLQLEPQAAGR